MDPLSIAFMLLPFFFFGYLYYDYRQFSKKHNRFKGKMEYIEKYFNRMYADADKYSKLHGNYPPPGWSFEQSALWDKRWENQWK